VDGEQQQRREIEDFGGERNGRSVLRVRVAAAIFVEHHQRGVAQFAGSKGSRKGQGREDQQTDSRTSGDYPAASALEKGPHGYATGHYKERADSTEERIGAKQAEIRGDLGESRFGSYDMFVGSLAVRLRECRK